MKIHTQAELTANIESSEVLEIVAAGIFSVALYGTVAPNIIVAHRDADVTVVAWGSSQPRVVARGSSQPRVVAWGSSQPHVEARESSQPRVVARGSSQPHVVARGSSQPHVEARGSSQPHVEARESSQPHVEARGSSQPRVVARESSQPHVEARGYSMLSLRGTVKATCTANVSVLIEGGTSAVEGGKQTFVQRATPLEWCEYYGIEVTGEIAIVYKAVDDNYRSPRGGDYTPGTIPIAPDWDGGKEECGGGFHFSPSPAMAREFFYEATKFLACPVALADIAVHPDGVYPQKIKARGCCAPVYEVDVDGERIKILTEVAK